MQKQHKPFQDQGRHTAAYIRAQKDKLMQSVTDSHADLALDSFYKHVSTVLQIRVLHQPHAPQCHYWSHSEGMDDSKG